ncbi:hypothetical protein Y032_0323g2479 [Ancylostoma ceylanicum]|uniref:Uncharacterized protein n=1 Tax=Ancylostoma ceylanicum TaxID=53326 RepID=A0A016S1H4_9BILA|nr:hypothetical protein Y032_0323g2479 [Ancylostoma ceylanicum]
MRTLPCVESANDCSGVGCARVPPRNPVNGTNCAHPLRQTTYRDGVNWRVGPLEGRHGRDRYSCFSAGRS